MATIMTLPKIGVNMKNATITEWLVAPGDKVTEGQPILNAETDKAVQEIPATSDGIVGKLLAEVGDTVNALEPIVVFVEEGEELPADFTVDDKEAAPVPATPAAAPVPTSAAPKTGSQLTVAGAEPEIVVLPKIGVNMKNATITEWLVAPGDQVTEGQTLLNAETDKAVQEIPSTSTGVVAKLLAEVGETVNALEPICIFVEEGDALPDDFVLGGASAPAPAPAPVQAEVVKQEAAKVIQPAVVKPGERVKVSPLAKKTAKDLGIDYRIVPPAAPGKRIVKADVVRYAESQKTAAPAAAVQATASAQVAAPTVSATPAPAAAVEQFIPYDGIRKIIGDRMSESVVSKPSVPLTLSVDMTAFMAWRDKLKAVGTKVSYNDILAAVVSRVLAEHRIINSRIVGDQIELLQDINIGIAVDTDRGLVVPVIKNADTKGVVAIHEDFMDKLTRIKAGSFDPDDITGGTFTITNLGMFEIENFVPVINPLESAILGVGNIVKTPVVDENDQVVVKPMMKLTLVFDHRVVDGAPAAKFLQRVKHIMESPIEIFM